MDVPEEALAARPKCFGDRDVQIEEMDVRDVAGEHAHALRDCGRVGFEKELDPRTPDIVVPDRALDCRCDEGHRIAALAKPLGECDERRNETSGDAISVIRRMHDSHD